MKKSINNQELFSITNLTLAGLFISIAVVLKSYLAINLSFTRISLAWVPIIIIGLLLGPIIGGVCGALADIIGFFIFPAGPYFFGFTVAYALVGIIPGLLRKVVLQTKIIYYFIFNAIFVMVLFVSSIWALFFKKELIFENKSVLINTNFFIKGDPSYTQVTVLSYLLIAIILILLLILPIILEKALKNTKFHFPISRIFFIVTITCIVCSLIIGTWSVSKVIGVPVLVLLPKRIFILFLTIPIYSYLVAALTTTLNKYIIKNKQIPQNKE